MKSRYARRYPIYYTENWAVMCSRMGVPKDHLFKVRRVNGDQIMLEDDTNKPWDLEKFLVYDSIYKNKKKGA
jgi:hypothetical protein